MKKPVIIIISLIYALAIVIVGFVGMAIKTFNPTIFSSQIKIEFDETLVARTNKKEGVDYAFQIITKVPVTFNITASILPENVTDKECAFEKRDESNKYTVSTTFNGQHTIATYNCEPAVTGSFYLIETKVKTVDGHKSLYKIVNIYVLNF